MLDFMHTPLVICMVSESAEKRASGCFWLEQVLQQPYTVVEADSGAAALALCGRSLPDVILLSDPLPDMDGLTFLEHLTQQTSHPQVPVILLANTEDSAVAVQAIKRGAQNYLVWSKLTATTLQEAIEAVVAGSFGRAKEQPHWSDRQQIETALQLSEEQLRLAVELTHIATWDWNLGTNVITWSDNHFYLLGLEIGSVMPSYQLWYDRVHPEDRDWVEQAITDALNNQTDFDTEYRVIYPNGEVHWLAGRGRGLYDEAGQPWRMLGTLLDVTDRKRVEQQLLQTNQDLEMRVARRTAALEVSEARYQAIVEDQTELIVRFSLDRRLQFVNDAYCRYFGFNPDDLIGRSYSPVIYEGDRERVEAQVATLSPENPTVTIENRVMIQGEIRWTQWITRMLFDDQGQVIEFQAVGRDITDLKQIEEALRLSEERLKLALEGSGTGLWDWNLITNDAYLSPNWLTMLGYGENELPASSDTWNQLMHPDDRPWVLERLQAHLSDSRVPYVFDYRMRTKSGEWKWVANYGRVVVRDEQGTPLRMVGTHEDISDRKQAEEQLRSLSDRLVLALRSGAIGTWDWDMVHEASWDDQMYELYGFQRAIRPAVYQDWIDALHPEDRAMAEAALQAALQGERDFDVEFRIFRPDGELRHMKATALIQRDAQGTPQRMVGINYDITERKQVEEQLRISRDRISLANAELARAARLKDEFLAGMSHELRTPLNAILGLSEAMLEAVYGSLNEGQQNALQIIQQSGHHLLVLINDILDLSKIESGRMDLEVSMVAVPTLCESSLAFVKQQASRKQISLNLTIADELTYIQVDERRIRQALVNLLSNAVKFTPNRGRVELQVRADANREMVEFRVMDTGIGIAPEQFNKLFQPFVQLDSSLSRRYEGTGLGLVLVRRIVELHSGSVSVESEVDQGSRFTIALPWNPALASIELAFSPELPAMLPPLQQVLLVEDSEPDTDQIVRYLSEINAETVTLAQGESVLDTALRIQPDIIILDILLPDQTGWDVLQNLKATPDTRDIPVLIVSVLDERAYGLELGASEYLVKPITRPQLQRAIGQILEEEPPEVQTALVVTPHDPANLPRILLAEDQEDNIATMVPYLQAQGFEILLARNGLEAIAQAEQHPDLILMDIQMPEMDGLEAIRRIRLNPNFSRVPIIALTALAMPGDRERCLEAGANEYLTKPVGLKQLLKVISAHVSVRQSRD